MEKPASGGRRKSPETLAREERLARALRANISKRKAQQRQRNATGIEERASGTDAGPEGGEGAAGAR